MLTWAAAVRPASRFVSPTTVSASNTIELGISFLKERLRAGQYGLSCYGSDGTTRVSHNKGHLFAGFFVAEAIGPELDEVERTALIVRLLSEESKGHWGYAPRASWDGPPDNPTFVDADDTAFALRTMRRLGLYRSPEALGVYRRTQRRVLRGGRQQDVGFVTFHTQKRPTLCLEADSSGNFDIHPEVNANVFLALAGTSHSGWIVNDLVTRSQASEGYWHSFFYPGKFYSTWLFMDLIGQLGGFEKERGKGTRFLTEAQNSDGSWGDGSGVLETALAVKSLMCVSAGDAVARGREFLVAAQREDGSWETDSVIWEFHESPSDIWQAKDANRVVVTALCLAALRQHLVA